MRTPNLPLPDDTEPYPSLLSLWGKWTLWIGTGVATYYCTYYMLAWLFRFNVNFMTFTAWALGLGILFGVGMLYGALASGLMCALLWAIYRKSPRPIFFGTMMPLEGGAVLSAAVAVPLAIAVLIVQHLRHAG